MKCSICPREINGDEIHHITIHKKEYDLCGWCAMRVMQYIDGNISHHVINIYWGAGHICWSSWDTLREIIKKYNITEVLEMGIGLSSEMFASQGLKIVGMDIWKEHVELYQQHLGLKNIAEFHWYPDSDHLPDFEALYPGRKWDFVFVDGPQERSREVALAMKLANKFIYLHDPNMGEQSFFPNDEWIGVGAEPRLFIKKGIEI
jgi:hypothetical protein